LAHGGFLLGNKIEYSDRHGLIGQQRGDFSKTPGHVGANYGIGVFVFFEGVPGNPCDRPPARSRKL
jgi:hypothetical protein